MKSIPNHEHCYANAASCHESRTPRFNLPVLHPAPWRFIADVVLSSPLRLHRMRNLTVRLVEDTLDELDRRHCNLESGRE